MVAFVAVGVVMAAVVFVPELASLMNQLPFRARWHLGLVVVSFVLAVLAGYGTDAVIRSPRDFTTRVWCGSGFGVTGLMVVALWFVGRGHLAPHAARLRTESFIWPAVLTVLGLVVVAALSRGATSVPSRASHTPPDESERGDGRRGCCWGQRPPFSWAWGRRCGPRARPS